MLICNGFIPILLWFRRVRHSIAALFVISLFINIGMWFERFVIIATSLATEFMPFAWNIYRPSVTEMGIMVGSFAWFSFWFLIFIRMLPPVAIAEMKEVLPPPMRGKPKRTKEVSS
jgi:Ni/Fe-hydrogenase subunit HybB-like protein